MKLTKGYLEFILKRFKKCERSLKSISPKKIAQIRDEIKKGNKAIVDWVLSVLQIYEYDFKKERKEIERYLAGAIGHAHK